MKTLLFIFTLVLGASAMPMEGTTEEPEMDLAKEMSIIKDMMPKLPAEVMEKTEENMKKCNEVEFDDFLVDIGKCDGNADRSIAFAITTNFDNVDAVLKTVCVAWTEQVS